MSVDIEAAAAAAKELQSPKTFNARAAANQTTYPEDSVDVYSDAKLAHSINVLANDAVKARYNAQLIWDKAYAEGLEQARANETAESDPEAEANAYADGILLYQHTDAVARDLEAELAEALPALRASMLTYHLRGLAPEQWRLIHKQGRREIKEPVRKHFEKGEDGDEAFQTETIERSIERTAWINNTCIASAIIKVTNSEGAVDDSVWKVEDVASIYGSYLESEYEKIKATMETLTFANNLFQVAVQQDADFLPKR